MAFVFSEHSSVRDALGLSLKELPDSVLESDDFARRLTLDFADIDSEIVDDYEEASLESTAAATNFVAAFETFAVLSYASYCASGLPQFSPRSVTDGKAGYTRFADSPYKETLGELASNLSRYRRILKERYAIWEGSPLAESTAPPRPFSVSTLATDPVTGS